MTDTMVQDRTVTGVLQFTVPTGEKIITQVSETGGGRNDPKTGQYEMREIIIHDGRPIAEELDMEVQGFEFLEYDTAVTDFTDDEQVKNIYYPELEKLLLERTGAKEVLIFDHTIRIGDRFDEALRCRLPSDVDAFGENGEFHTWVRFPGA